MHQAGSCLFKAACVAVCLFGGVASADAVPIAAAGTAGASYVVGTTGTVTATNSPANSQALKLVDAAITKVTGFLSKIGSAINQVDGLKDFTSSLNASLTEGLGALVDADLTEESAQLSSLQTKQQLATQSLSIANQGSQNLLSLFRG